MKNYYEILEVRFNAPQDEIKKAFRLKAIKYHPDKHNGDNYFTEKFIEVREAFDVLTDSQKKDAYDLNYKVVFLKEVSLQKATVQEERRKEKEKEEQFFYDPYKPFYSYQDRTQQETPQFKPKINHWGEILPEEADFFTFPKQIGKVISGYTTLSVKMKPYAKKKGWFSFLTYTPKFKHTCNFIGINGFAEFKCAENRENIVSSYELHFNDITDLVKVSVVHKHNYSYMHTEYEFIWMNNNKIVKSQHGTHSSKENNPEKSNESYWLNTFAERYWTVFLLDKMENELENKGYLQFNLCYSKDDKLILSPHIQLGIGYIKFINPKGDVNYNFNEIKRVYTKGTNLFIEHINYEKKFLFFESGNKNGIPLLNLCNRQFFFRAMELLLGYKFS